jgi:cell wall-associated NlpC family hydrolase
VAKATGDATRTQNNFSTNQSTARLFGLTWAASPANFQPPMKLLLPALLLSLTCAFAQAAPAEESFPNMNSLLASKGALTRLGTQLELARDGVGEKASQLVANAMGFLGVPYKYGGISAEAGGFDCSGLVRAVYEQSVGKVLPRRASDQAAATQTIDRQELKPGDLVFFNTMKRAFSHVGIYVGDGQFIHAPRAGATVRVEDMRQAYWQKRFNGARRVVVPAVSPQGIELPLD